jgi:diguanylate cyclase (GGDEF)-like protein
VRACVREVDVSTRPGGDEFAVLLPNTSLQEAAHVAQRICDRLHREEIRHEGDDGSTLVLRVTGSFGVAAADGLDPRVTPELLYQRADEALYRAKAAGRGQVAVAGAELGAGELDAGDEGA